MASDGSHAIERPRDLEVFAVECALDAARRTELSRPAYLYFGYIDYVEAAATRNIGLLRGFEDLAETAQQRGILPSVEGEQARLVTDGGNGWQSERGNYQNDAQTHEDQT